MEKMTNIEHSLAHSSRGFVIAILAGLTMFCNPMGAHAQEQEIVSEASEYAAEELSPTYDDPMVLIEAFKSSLAENDVASLTALLGLDVEKVMSDENTLETFVKIRDGVAKQLVLDESRTRILLEIGDDLWPFPFPIVKDDDGKWSFDTMAGLEEIVNRRVGENELEAIATANAYVDAQRDYAASDRDGDGVLEYAQKLISAEGQADGLYWPESAEFGISPAGDFVSDEALEDARGGQGYFGYRFRILKRQGDNIAGGAYDYVINGNMIAGFALIAYPVEYGITGVNTFLVSHHGAVYEKDLGPQTADIVPYIDSFNPDESWSIETGS
jgi:hypothetical protein